MYRPSYTGVIITAVGIIFLLFPLMLIAKDMPSAPDGSIREGKALFDSGKYSAALERYIKAEKRYPADSRLMYETALTYYALGNFRQALAYAQKSGGLNSGPAEPDILIGNSHGRMNSPDNALKAYLTAADKNPDNPMVFFNLGIFYFNTGQFTKAETALSKAISMKPLFPSAFYAAGYVYIRLNNHEKAEDSFRTFLTLETRGSRFEEVSRILATYFNSGQ